MPKPGYKVITVRKEVLEKLEKMREQLAQETQKPVSLNDVLKHILTTIEEEEENVA